MVCAVSRQRDRLELALTHTPFPPTDYQPQLSRSTEAILTLYASLSELFNIALVTISMPAESSAAEHAASNTLSPYSYLFENVPIIPLPELQQASSQGLDPDHSRSLDLSGPADTSGRYPILTPTVVEKSDIIDWDRFRRDVRRCRFVRMEDQKQNDMTWDLEPTSL